MILATVSLDFTTRKKLTDDMILSWSEQLAHLSASFSMARNRKSASVIMTVESTFLEYADRHAREPLEHELLKYRIKPKYTRIETRLAE